FLLSQAPPLSRLLPYTTLFRSRAGFLDQIQLDAQIDHLTHAVNTLAIHDLEFGLAERWRHLVFYHLDAGFRAGDLLAVLHCAGADRKSTRLNSSHVKTSYAVFC